MGLSISPKVGIGFRSRVADKIAENLASFDVFEVTVDHILSGDARYRAQLERFIGRVPMVAHGVGLSLGTDVPLDMDYLTRVADALQLIDAPYYSEHLSFSGVPGETTSELLPLPRSREAARRAIENIDIVQSTLKLPFCLENIAYYFDYPQHEMAEHEFFGLVCRETGCHVLLDLQNLYVNSFNHGSSPETFIRSLPKGSVKAIHLAGGRFEGDLLIDTHSYPIAQPVFDLLELTLELQSPDCIIVERDDRLQEFHEVVEDMRITRLHVNRALHRQSQSRVATV